MNVLLCAFAPCCLLLLPCLLHAGSMQVLDAAARAEAAAAATPCAAFSAYLAAFACNTAQVVLWWGVETLIEARMPDSSWAAALLFCGGLAALKALDRLEQNLGIEDDDDDEEEDRPVHSNNRTSQVVENVIPRTASKVRLKAPGNALSAHSRNAYWQSLRLLRRSFVPRGLEHASRMQPPRPRHHDMCAALIALANRMPSCVVLARLHAVN
jgi:hypothetical protein